MIIIKNKLGDIWLWACSKFNHFPVDGFAFPEVIVLHTKIDISKRSDYCLLEHEREHIRQQRRYFYLVYWVLYVYYWAIYGYNDTPFEIQAYNVQTKCMIDRRAEAQNAIHTNSL